MKQEQQQQQHTITPTVALPIFKICFYFFFRQLFPLQRHFFVIRVLDSTKTYKPTTYSLLDLPTAISFFKDDPEATRRLLIEQTHQLVDRWNEKYDGVGANVSPRKTILMYIDTLNKSCRCLFCLQMTVLSRTSRTADRFQTSTTWPSTSTSIRVGEIKQRSLRSP